MKVKFWMDLCRPLYVDGINPPVLFASSLFPATKYEETIRLSFEVDIPDHLIKVQDVVAPETQAQIDSHAAIRPS